MRFAHTSALLLLTTSCGQVLTIEPDWPDATPGLGDAEPLLDSGGSLEPGDAGEHLDSGFWDTGTETDSGAWDAGFLDTGPADAGMADTGPADTGLTDTGATDSGASFMLTINVVGPGRVISANPTIDCDNSCVTQVPAGTSVDLTAVPVGDARLVDWSAPCTGAGDECNIVIQQDRVLDAEFEMRPPLVSNGQAADLVLGQPDFTTITPVSPSRYSFNFPTRCAVEGNRLWVTDEQNHRVLQWDAIPLFNQAGADNVIGQGDFVASIGEVAADRLDRVADLDSDGQRLFVVDSARILVFDPIPGGSGRSASMVWGQTDFSSSMVGTSASRFSGAGLQIVGGRMFLADEGNNRVLIWNSIPTSSGLHPADLVLGSSNFTSSSVTSPPTASSLYYPMDVFYSESTDTLVVADTLNNRVLIWNSLPTTNNQRADVVLGQTSFTVKQPNAGAPTANQIGLAQPRSVAIAGGALFVADTTNERVLIWRPIPTSSAEPASWVLGRSTFGDEGGSASATKVGNPFGVCVGGNHLWVTNSNWHRVTRFQLTP